MFAKVKIYFIILGVLFGLFVLSDALLLKSSFAEEATSKVSVTNAPEEKVNFSPGLDIKSSAIKMIQGLALCVGLLLLLVWIQKKMYAQKTTKGGRSLAILERLPTGPKTQILLISVKGREYLVGQGSDSVNIYGEVVHEETVEEPEKKPV